MRNRLMTVAAAAALMVAGTAQAALIVRGGGMIYDTTLNITWLADWNYAKTQYVNSGGSQGDPDGTMTWAAANVWANNLVFGGFDDWRLPTSLNADGTDPCSVYNCSDSEMGHMFYSNWGASAASHFSTGTNTANLALFSNVQFAPYWSGTEYAPNPVRAWNFSVVGGSQSNDTKSIPLYAVAVRNGDVAAVPEPATLALVAAALLGVAATRKRKPKTVTC